MIAWPWFDLGPRPPCAASALAGEVVQLAVESVGRKLGGLGLVTLDGERYSLSLLTPAGTELFTVHGPPHTVDSAVATWTPILAHLPIERDLRLALTSIEGEACRTTSGRVRQRTRSDGWDRRWYGRGGPARASRTGKIIEVTEARYTLRLVVEDGLGPR
jgi:hypothetical protein